jgi:hypothetical protein
LQPARRSRCGSRLQSLCSWKKSGSLSNSSYDWYDRYVWYDRSMERANACQHFFPKKADCDSSFLGPVVPDVPIVPVVRRRNAKNSSRARSN